jgi:hypothetical protein
MPQQREQAGPVVAAEPTATERRRIDLSVAQVAASALATVAGAVLASSLNVYGTVIGAAVVSVGATVGGALFQHVFRRTGEQLRYVVERAPEDRPRQSPTGISSEWSEPRLVRAKRRPTWKTYAAMSGLVFVLAMVPIVSIELAAGRTMHDITTGQSGSGTSFSPHGESPRGTPAHEPSGGGSGSSPSNVPSSPAAGPGGTPSGGPSSVAPSASQAASPAATPTTAPTQTAPPAATGTPSAPATGTSGDAVTPSGTPTP